MKLVAASLGIPAWQPARMADPGFVEEIRRLDADLAVVAAFGRILSESFIALPRLGTINVHASLLPRWRGASPVQHALMAGDRETGITIMRIVKALDAGPMLAAVSRAIGDEETSEVVEADLATLGAALLVDTVDRLSAGPVPEIVQDESLVTLAPRMTKESGRTDWQLDAVALHNRVRGLRPWPLAFTSLAGERIALLRSRIAARLERDPIPDPGTIVEITRSGVRIAAGGGTSLEVQELLPEGRRAMTAREFATGRRISAGARFGP